MDLCKTWNLVAGGVAGEGEIPATLKLPVFDFIQFFFTGLLPPSAPFEAGVAS